jgi:hypothetical protein
MEIMVLPDERFLASEMMSLSFSLSRALVLSSKIIMSLSCKKARASAR